MVANDIVDMQDNRWLEVDERGAPLVLETIRLYPDTQGNFIIRSPDEIVETLPWNYKVPIGRETHVFIGITQLMSRMFDASYTVPTIATDKIGERLSTEEGWRRFEISINALNDFANSNEVDLVYALIPPNPNKAQDVDHHTHEQMIQIIQNHPETLYVDLKPHLTSDAYFNIDAHFNELGNKITSQIIIAFLIENKLVSN